MSENDESSPTLSDGMSGEYSEERKERVNPVSRQSNKHQQNHQRRPEEKKKQIKSEKKPQRRPEVKYIASDSSEEADVPAPLMDNLFVIQ